MKEYIRQFYNEGFATTFYLPLIKYIKEHVRNKIVANILMCGVKILFTVIVLTFAVFMFCKQWPL